MDFVKISNDPATLQTAAGFPDIKSIQTAFAFTKAEKERLRMLGECVAQIAALPIQKEKAKKWELHNDLKSSEPMVFIDPENGWNECITANSLLCIEPLARVWEMYLLKQIYWHEKLKDDKVIEPYFDVPYSYSDTGWGIPIIKHGGEGNGAYIVKQSIVDYEEDFQKIQYPKLIIDYEESKTIMELAQEVFDGILTVRQKGTWWWTLGMTWDYINMRGLEDFMCDFLMEPEYIHKTMNLLCEGVLNRLDFLEEKNLLSLNTDGTYVGSGGFGYTGQLKGPSTFVGNVTTKDMWGFVESQETTSINPELYGEFIFPYHKKIAQRFALNCYGCCEPYNSRWKFVKELPRLRRVSCSPWADWSRIADDLGINYIASIKPTPTSLAMPVMNEDVVRADIRRALQCSKDCIPEIIMKDNNTLGRNPSHASRWVEMVREEIINVG